MLVAALMSLLASPAHSQARAAEAYCYACRIGMPVGWNDLADTLACNGHEPLPPKGRAKLYVDSPGITLVTSDGALLGVEVHHDDTDESWGVTEPFTDLIGVRRSVGGTKRGLPGEKTKIEGGISSRGPWSYQVTWDKPAQTIVLRGGDGVPSDCEAACPVCPHPPWTFDPQNLHDLLVVLGAPPELTPPDLINQLSSAGYQSDEGHVWRHGEFGVELFLDHGRLNRIVAGEWAFPDLPVPLPRRRELVEHAGLVRKPQRVGDPAVVVYDASTEAVQRFLVFEVGFEDKGYTDRIGVTVVQDRWAPTKPRVADARGVERYLERESMMRRSGELALLDAMGIEVWVPPREGWACELTGEVTASCHAPPDVGLSFDLGVRANVGDERLKNLLHEVMDGMQKCESPKYGERTAQVRCTGGDGRPRIVRLSEVGENAALSVVGLVRPGADAAPEVYDSAVDAFVDGITTRVK